MRAFAPAALPLGQILGQIPKGLREEKSAIGVRHVEHEVVRLLSREIAIGHQGAHDLQGVPGGDAAGARVVERVPVVTDPGAPRELRPGDDDVTGLGLSEVLGGLGRATAEHPLPQDLDGLDVAFPNDLDGLAKPPLGNDLSQVGEKPSGRLRFRGNGVGPPTSPAQEVT